MATIQVHNDNRKITSSNYRNENRYAYCKIKLLINNSLETVNSYQTLEKLLEYVLLEKSTSQTFL